MLPPYHVGVGRVMGVSSRFLLAKTYSNVLAHWTRLFRPSRPQSSCRKCKKEVCVYAEFSAYMVPSSWMSVLAGIYGEMINAGTLVRVSSLYANYLIGNLSYRTPRRVKS